MEDFWRAVGLLHLDRPAGLSALERSFAAGRAPAGMSGPYRGRLLATTLGPGRDLVAEGLARLWLPWRGKTFDGDGGANLFTAWGLRLLQLRFRDYRGVEVEPDGAGSAFRFRTSTGPSEQTPDVQVLRIDYQAVPENPPPVREVLDELVQATDDRWLGQALVRRGGRWRRAAWFSLEPWTGAGTP